MYICKYMCMNVNMGFAAGDQDDAADVHGAARATPGHHPHASECLRPVERESSLLTTYWSKFITSTR